MKYWPWYTLKEAVDLSPLRQKPPYITGTVSLVPKGSWDLSNGRPFHPHLPNTHTHTHVHNTHTHIFDLMVWSFSPSHPLSFWVRKFFSSLENFPTEPRDQPLSFLTRWISKLLLWSRGNIKDHALAERVWYPSFLCLLLVLLAEPSHSFWCTNWELSSFSPSSQWDLEAPAQPGTAQRLPCSL